MADLASALAALSSFLAEEDNETEKISNKLTTANENSAPSITQSRFMQLTLTRMQKCQARLDQQLEEKRQVQLEKELKEVKQKPSINSKSRQLKRLPLYMRVSQVLNEKNHHMTNLRTEAQSSKKAELDECTFQPNRTTKRTRTSEQFCQQSQGWLERKRHNIERYAIEKKEQESRELTLRPVISKASQRITSKKPHVPLLERLTRSKTPDLHETPRTPNRAKARTPTLKHYTPEDELDLSNLENSYMTVEYKPDLEFLLKTLI